MRSCYGATGFRFRLGRYRPAITVLGKNGGIYMKIFKSLKVMLLTALFTLAMASVAFAGPQDFTLVNKTGHTIYVVNISASTTDDWEEDVLGSQLLHHGESLEVSFDAGNQQHWDIQVTFEDGSTLSWMDIDLFAVYQITLNSDGSASLN